MNLPGIDILIVHDQFKSCNNEISQQSGTGVYCMVPEACRPIVTVYAEFDIAQIEGLKSNQALAYVILAELVFQRFDEEDDQFSLPITCLYSWKWSAC